MRGHALLLGLAVLAMVEGSARADGKALAEQLFRKAQALMQDTATQEQVHQACLWFRESQAQDAAINTQVALAACYEREGKNVSAWGLYTDLAGAGGAAAQYAKERAGALQAKGFLKVRLSAKALPPNAKVVLDGDPVGAAALNTDMDADPGAHTVVVSRPGKTDSQRSFKLTAETSPLTVDLDAGVEAAPPLGPPPPSQASPGSKGGLSGRAIVGLVAAGAGLAAIGVGSGFGALALGKKSDSDRHCNLGGKANDCDAIGVGLRGDAVTAGNVSTALLIAGGVLAAGGVVLWLTAPSAKTRVAFTGQALVVAGAF